MNSNLKWNLWSARGASIVLMLLSLAAEPALAEVPQYLTFSGRLVDDAGTPLVGTVAFELWIYDDPTGGNSLYGEGQSGVTLDAQGNFSVLLGTGWDLGVGNHLFDATIFSGPDRYVEVVLLEPTFAVLTPRVPIASVPWALVAERLAPWDPGTTARFEDCGDGTVADHQTGLQWEKKTGTVGAFVYCRTVDCPDPHIVNNLYQWSNLGGAAPDAGAFTDFLTKLNDPVFGAAVTMSDVTGCFAGHCDWRLPTITELRTILIGTGAAPGQATTCSAAPCIDPGFAAVGGPTASAFYWSASTDAWDPVYAWHAYFGLGGSVDSLRKVFDDYVRAVRAGSCN